MKYHCGLFLEGRREEEANREHKIIYLKELEKNYSIYIYIVIICSELATTIVG